MIKHNKFKVAIIVITSFVILFGINAYAKTSETKEDAIIANQIEESLSETIGTMEGFESNPYYEVLRNMTERDRIAMFEVVYHESAGAFYHYEEGSFELNVCVIETILNRVLSGKWGGNTVYDVCHKSGQFVCKPYNYAGYDEEISDALEHVWHEGPTMLPSTDYVLFAIKKQTLGKDHVWRGQFNSNGSPKKGKGMYFCREK